MVTEVSRFLDGGEKYTIASEEIEAAFAPDMGGRMLSLRYRGTSDILVPMQAHRFNIVEWPRAGAYPLFPYHNRLSEAKVRVGDETVELAAHPVALPHTLHGPAHARPWRVTRHERDHLVMALDYAADADWPWAFTAVQDFRVQGSVLAVKFSLTNNASKPMPGGIGWHPYFASATQPVSDAAFVWPHAEDYLPTGQKEAVADRVEQENRPTSYLQGWTFARIAADAGLVTTMSASSPFDYLVVHRGDPSHVCVEPTTHVANAWNLDADAPTVGARVLQPEERIEGTVKLAISS